MHLLLADLAFSSLLNFRNVHKQRLKLLEPLLKELNPNVFLTTVQQILFTCAEIHEAMLNLRLKTLKHSKPTKDETQKINLKYVQIFACGIRQLIHGINPVATLPLPTSRSSLRCANQQRQARLRVRKAQARRTSP